jgi:DNA-binding NarL/FixJ family response regulator
MRALAQIQADGAVASGVRVRVLSNASPDAIRRTLGGAQVPATVAVVPNAEVAREALEAGAAGVVLSADLDRALEPTIRAVAAGQVVVPAALRGSVERPAFTAREKQVLSLIVLGCTNRDIARRLHVAETTVKSHVKSSFHKLGVSSRSEACAKILDPREGLGLGILGLSEAARR